MIFKRFICSLFVSVFLFCGSVHTWASKLKFEHIGSDEGLSDMNALNVMIDSYGYVWISTTNGLNRYDGYTCKVYKNNEKQENSLGHNFVQKVVEDSKKRLWVIYRFGGVSLFNRETDDFNNFVFADTLKDGKVVKNNFRNLYEDSEHNIWLISNNSILKLQPDLTIIKEYHQSDKFEAFSNDHGFTCDQAPDGTFVFSFRYSDKIFVYNKFSDSFNDLQLPPFNGTSPGAKILVLRFDKDSKLWVGTTGKGVVIADLKRNKTCDLFLPNEWERIGANEVQSIFFDSRFNAWIGTVNGGLVKYSLMNGKFDIIKNDYFNLFSISSNSPSCVTQDKLGNIWVSTHGGGINVFNTHKNKFRLFSKSYSHTSGVSSNIISAFYQDKQGYVWIGTDGGGINKFDPKTLAFEYFNHGKQAAAVLDIEPNGDGNLWLCSWGGGVALFNPKSSSYSFLPVAMNDKQALCTPNVKGILKDGDMLWIASHGGGLHLYDMKTKTVYNYLNPAPWLQFDMKTPQWGNDICKDSRGNFWIYTVEGLYRTDGKSLKAYMHSQNDSTTISGQFVSCVFEDSRGTIWVGNDGLDRYNYAQNNFTRMNDLHTSLPNNIKSISEDGHNNLWLSTSQGLACFNPLTGSVKKYNESDGLQGNQFSQRASMLAANGELYMGGINGFNVFDPALLMETKRAPSIYVTGIQTLESNPDGSLNLKLQSNNKSGHDVLEIPYKSSIIISIEYVALNIDNPRKVEYSYMLEGFKNKWVKNGNERKATYTNLPPGTYKFYVIATNPDGVSSNEAATLAFTILPPWWSTWWFRILVMSVLVSMVVLYVYQRERNIRIRNRKLEAIVHQRTSELEAANKSLTEQKEEISRHNQNLREHKLIIENKNKELEEVIETKDKLISIIAHDFKNPLAVLIGYVQMIRDSLNRGEKHVSRNYIEILANSINVMQIQFNQILDWAASRSSSSIFKPEDTNILQTLKDAESLVFNLAVNKNITITTDVSTSRSSFTDPRMMVTVFRNLLSNSIKFTNRGGVISVKVTENPSHILVSVSDNGVGMDKTQIDNILHGSINSISYGTEREKGLGLGLHICVEFIHRNGGQLAIESQPGKGTSMEISLPKGETLFNTSEANICFAQTLASESTEDYTIRQQGDVEMVLVIEDNNEVSQLIHNLLSPIYKVELAFDGLEGYHKSNELIPDLILCDINLPGMNGLEICYNIKNNPLTSHVPIIIITSESKPSLQIEGLKAGADDYVIKPFNIDVLKFKVQSILRNRELARKYFQKEIMNDNYLQISESYDDSFINKVTDLIKQNLSNADLSVEYLAKEAGISRSQLFRKFKTLLGSSPNDYIKAYRLQVAMKILKTGKHRISDVAYQVGFSDPKYFTTCFTQVFGKNPSFFVDET